SRPVQPIHRPPDRSWGPRSPVATPPTLGCTSTPSASARTVTGSRLETMRTRGTSLACTGRRPWTGTALHPKCAVWNERVRAAAPPVTAGAHVPGPLGAVRRGDVRHVPRSGRGAGGRARTGPGAGHGPHPSERSPRRAAHQRRVEPGDGGAHRGGG